MDDDAIWGELRSAHKDELRRWAILMSVRGHERFEDFRLYSGLTGYPPVGKLSKQMKWMPGKSKKWSDFSWSRRLKKATMLVVDFPVKEFHRDDILLLTMKIHLRDEVLNPMNLRDKRHQFVRAMTMVSHRIDEGKIDMTGLKGEIFDYARMVSPEAYSMLQDTRGYASYLLEGSIRFCNVRNAMIRNIWDGEV